MSTCHVCRKPLEISTKNRCVRCGAPQGLSKNTGDNFLMRMVVPVKVSGWAIAAGYLGLFSIMILPAPFALFCGIMGIRSIKQNPDLHGLPRSIFGIIFGLIGTLFIALAFIRPFIR